MSEHEWIVESIVQFLRSPMWNGPVNNFIDDNCDIFDNDSEMKVQYTTLHRKFRELLDKLLTDFVTELGIPLDTVLNEVRTCVMTTDENKITKPMRRLLSFIFSMDDFLSFHAMMVKRNMELDVMAYAALRAKGLVPDEPRQQVDVVSDAPVSASERRAFALNGKIDEEEAFSLAIQASLEESGALATLAELEVAQLHEAMMLNAEMPGETGMKSALAIAKAGVENATGSTPLSEVNAVEPQVARGEQCVMASDTASTAQVSSTVVATAVEAKEQKREHLATRTLTAQSATLTPVVATQSMAPTQASAPPSAVPASRTTAPALGAAKALPPIAATGGPAGGMPPAPLPPNKSTSAPKKAASKPSTTGGSVVSETPGQAAMPSKEELERRAAHMRALREKIIERNKANRQQEMDEYAQKNNVKLPTAPNERSAAEKQLTIDIARRLREDIVEEARKA